MGYPYSEAVKLKVFVSDNADYTAQYAEYTLRGVYTHGAEKKSPGETMTETAKVYIFTDRVSVTDSAGALQPLPHISTKDIIVLHPGTTDEYEARVAAAAYRRGVSIPEYVRLEVK